MKNVSSDTKTRTFRIISLMQKFDEEQTRYIKEKERLEEEAQLAVRKPRGRGRGRGPRISASPQRGSTSMPIRSRDSPAEASRTLSKPSGADVKVKIIHNRIFKTVSQKKIIKYGKSMIAELSKILNNIGLTRAKLLDLDYLFVPNYNTKGHHVLTCLVPKQGFVFIIDSCEFDYPKEEWLALGLLALSLFVRPDGVDWLLYG
jgi:hypothetical protein